MKIKRHIVLIVLLAGLNANGQSSVAVTTPSNCRTQIVTMVIKEYTVLSYNFTTNQIVIVNSFATLTGSGSSRFDVKFGDSITNTIAINATQNIGASASLVLTGITRLSSNDQNSTEGLLTFTVLTPSTNSASVTPVNSVVIPSDATGNVQIILESSSDMVNWIPSQAGTYGNTYTNRFFRVRALAQ